MALKVKTPKGEDKPQQDAFTRLLPIDPPQYSLAFEFDGTPESAQSFRDFLRDSDDEWTGDIAHLSYLLLDEHLTFTAECERDDIEVCAGDVVVFDIIDDQLKEVNVYGDANGQAWEKVRRSYKIANE